MAAVERGGKVRGAGNEVFASAPEGSRKTLLPPSRKHIIPFFFSFSLPLYPYSRVEKCTGGARASRYHERRTPLSLVELVRDCLDAYGGPKHDDYRRPLEKEGNGRHAFKYPNSHPALRGGGFVSPVLCSVFQHCSSTAPSRRQFYPLCFVFAIWKQDGTTPGKQCFLAATFLPLPKD